MVSRVSCSITFPETEVRLTKPAFFWIILHTFLGGVSDTCSLLVLKNLSQSLRLFKDYWECSCRISASSLSSCVFNLSVPSGLKYVRFVLVLLCLVLFHWGYVLIQIFLWCQGLEVPKGLSDKDWYGEGCEYLSVCHLCPYPPGLPDLETLQLATTTTTSLFLPPCFLNQKGPFLPGRVSLPPTLSSVIRGYTITPGPGHAPCCLLQKLALSWLGPGHTVFYCFFKCKWCTWLDIPD